MSDMYQWFGGPGGQSLGAIFVSDAGELVICVDDDWYNGRISSTNSLALANRVLEAQGHGYSVGQNAPMGASSAELLPGDRHTFSFSIPKPFRVRRLYIGGASEDVKIERLRLGPERIEHVCSMPYGLRNMCADGIERFGLEVPPVIILPGYIVDLDVRRVGYVREGAVGSQLIQPVLFGDLQPREGES